MSEISIDEPEAIPETLRERDQWVCWREEERDGKSTKIPVTPGVGGFASATESETWAGFEAALNYSETEHADGVGFVFTDDDPIVGVDLDDCRDPETDDIDDTALDIIKRLDSYTEVSPSGTGYHVLITGTLPDGRNRRGSVELYGDEVHYADGSTYGEKTIERAIATTSEFYDPDAGDDVADPHGTPDGVAAGGTPAETDRSRAYLTEKNRLLSERVDELEATLEQKTERIETLEAEIERLTEELAARDQETEQSHKKDSGTADETGDDSEPASLLHRFFGGQSE